MVLAKSATVNFKGLKETLLGLPIFAQSLLDTA